jgi:hypothetical protein
MLQSQITETINPLTGKGNIDSLAVNEFGVDG